MWSGYEGADNKEKQRDSDRPTGSSNKQQQVSRRGCQPVHGAAFSLEFWRMSLDTFQLRCTNDHVRQSLGSKIAFA